MVWIVRSRLVTAHILYRMPDHLWLLQDYVWQEYDRLPDYPALRKFIAFWRDTLDGPIHSVKVADAEIAGDDIMRFADFEGMVQ